MAEIDDLTQIIVIEGFDDETVEQRLEQLMWLARQEIERMANRALNSTASAYLRVLTEPRVDRDGGMLRARVSLGDERIHDPGDVGFARMLEMGAPSWDLRDTLLPGRNPETLNGPTKSGHFTRSIPFKHGMPGGSGAPSMGSQFTRAGLGKMSRAHRGDLSKRQAVQLGEDVATRAAELSPTRTHPGRKTRYGDSLPADLAPILRERHLTDIYAGMYRQEKVYERATEQSFITFRTISSDPRTFRSDAGGRNWTHPGFEARHLFAQASDYVRLVAGSMDLQVAPNG